MEVTTVCARAEQVPDVFSEENDACASRLRIGRIEVRSQERHSEMCDDKIGKPREDAVQQAPVGRRAAAAAPPWCGVDPEAAREHLLEVPAAQALRHVVDGQGLTPVQVHERDGGVENAARIPG